MPCVSRGSTGPACGARLCGEPRPAPLDVGATRWPNSWCPSLPLPAASRRGLAGRIRPRTSSSGRTVYQRTLEQRRTAASARRDFGSVSAPPWNLDATLNGKAVSAACLDQRSRCNPGRPQRNRLTSSRAPRSRAGRDRRPLGVRRCPVWFVLRHSATMREPAG